MTFLLQIGIACLAVSAVVVGLFAVELILVRKRERHFDACWPPITDEEFLARCSPGVSRDTALRTRRIVAEQLGIPYDQVHPDQDFVHDLDC
ncbi:acyl carrier protein [Lignipirellula cremea]|uniref:Acyl carrier protein n=1 Tax=Lignipirellula cremea TaxID=2528010 RepID=A0A518E328_9BACT|nr:hypothetical protein [Lignipirellula cremea]QDU98488.1 Acyl carrier protein [Lignipirellula cremea]